MKYFWLDAREWNRDLITTALESGADGIVVNEDKVNKVKELGIIKTIAENGDIKLGEDVIELEINSKADEDEAVKHSNTRMVIVKTGDWMVIPLENLISRASNIIAFVKSSQEAVLAMGALQTGVSGVLLKTDDINEIKKVARMVKESSEHLDLDIAKITNTKQLGLGDRVCVDTCTNMIGSQGMLVGNSSSGMFLVRAENIETPYCDPRPFRVNAGGVHAYVRVPDGKTRYLADLKTGDEVLIVDSDGNGQAAFVGRNKIERRPMILVEAECEDKKKVSLILQNAETIRLTKTDGSPISVAKLSKGDEVLVFVEDSGRHFGVKIDENIVEK
ncbi:3-dehydroquinate synthase II [Candidatus Poribacteria bacterium]|nr:3-dehydroquinate synthase II [Candidatus Poribacteria bacterium]